EVIVVADGGRGAGIDPPAVVVRHNVVADDRPGDPRGDAYAVPVAGPGRRAVIVDRVLVDLGIVRRAHADAHSLVVADQVHLDGVVVRPGIFQVDALFLRGKRDPVVVDRIALDGITAGAAPESDPRPDVVVGPVVQDLAVVPVCEADAVAGIDLPVIIDDV